MPLAAGTQGPCNSPRLLDRCGEGPTDHTWDTAEKRAVWRSGGTSRRKLLAKTPLTPVGVGCHQDPRLSWV